MSLPTEFFRTARLVFRPFDPADVDALHAIMGDPEVSRYVGDGKPLTRELTALWIERSRANVAKHNSGTGALVAPATGELVGWAGIGRPGGHPPEIVYGLVRSQWGRGLGREIAAALADWALGTAGLVEIHATVDPANTASVRILLSLGFELLGAGDELDENQMPCHRYVRRAGG